MLRNGKLTRDLPPLAESGTPGRVEPVRWPYVAVRHKLKQSLAKHHDAQVPLSNGQPLPKPVGVCATPLHSMRSHPAQDTRVQGGAPVVHTPSSSAQNWLNCVSIQRDPALHRHNTHVRPMRPSRLTAGTRKKFGCSDSQREAALLHLAFNRPWRLDFHDEPLDGSSPGRRSGLICKGKQEKNPEIFRNRSILLCISQGPFGEGRKIKLNSQANVGIHEAVYKYEC